MNKSKYFVFITILVAPLAFGCSSSPKENSDLKTLAQNYRIMLEETTTISSEYKDKSASEIINNTKRPIKTKVFNNNNTYYFGDLDYTDDLRRTAWPALDHLKRAFEIAICAYKKNDNDIKDIAIKLVDNWANHTYKAANWHHNEIGAPGALTDIGIFLFDDLSSKTKEAINGKVRNSSIYYRPALSLHRGANLIDYAKITFKNGIVNRNIDETDVAFNRFVEEIKENDIEGYQDEGSYFQHGRLLSTGSYGLTTIKMAPFIYTFNNTKYALPSDKTKILMNYLNVGLRYMLHRDKLNYMCIGRSFCNRNCCNIGSNASGLANFDSLNCFTDEEKATIRGIKNNIDNKNSAFTGMKIFPKAKIIVNNIDNVYMAFRGTDPIIVNSECLNNENEYGYNFSFGMNTCIMQSGNEYNTLSPVCNFSYMPGATSKDYGSSPSDLRYTKEGDEALMAHIKELDNERFEDKVETYRNNGDKYIYNIVQEDDCAISYQQGKHSKKKVGDKEFEGQEFTVSCFMSNEGMALLGAGMRDLDDPNANRYVTLQQCVLKSDDKIEDVASSNTFTHTYKNVSGVTYKALSGSIDHKVQSDVVGDVKRSHSTAKSSPVKETLLLARMQIDNNKTYAYSIQPTSKKDTNFKVAINNENIQAVELPNGKIAACFYNKNEKAFDYDGKTYTLTKEFVDGLGAYQIFNKQ